MKSSLFLSLIVLTSLISTNLTFAVTVEASSSSRFQVYRSDEFAAVNPQGWWLFLGMTTGFLDYNNSDRYQGGTQVHAKIGGSYFFDGPYNFDALMGIASNYVEKNNDNSNHLSGVLETNFKFEIDPYLDIGPSLLTLLGNGDRFNSSLNSMTSLIGIGVFKDYILEDKNVIRLGFRALTDLTVKSGDLQVYLIDFQLGLPFKTRGDVINTQSTTVDYVPKKQTFGSKRAK